jgi:hypothetical protein
MAGGTGGTARSSKVEFDPYIEGGGPESARMRWASLSTVSTEDPSIDGVGTAAIGSDPVFVAAPAEPNCLAIAAKSLIFGIAKIQTRQGWVAKSNNPSKLSEPVARAYPMKTLVILAASSALLARCSNPKEANKGNFQHAIGEWIEKSPPCLSMPDGSVTVAKQTPGELPLYVEATPASQPFSEESRQRHLAPLDALVNAGLLKSSRTEVEQGQSMFGNDTKKVAVFAYDFTDKGKSAFKEEAQKSSFGGTHSGFCYGKPEVDEVTQFTQPGDMMGMTISQVSYKYHLADLPDWAKNPKVKAAFPDLARNTADNLESKAALVLTNDGWKHEKAI